MKISTKGRYALRFMLDLAANGEGRYVPLKEISARQGISLKYLEQIVSQFGKLGLLESVRGPQGGYRLAKLPKDYTVGEILRYAEGELAPVSGAGGQFLSASGGMRDASVLARTLQGDQRICGQCNPGRLAGAAEGTDQQRILYLRK